MAPWSRLSLQQGLLAALVGLPQLLLAHPYQGGLGPRSGSSGRSLEAASGRNPAGMSFLCTPWRGNRSGQTQNPARPQAA